MVSEMLDKVLSKEKNVCELENEAKQKAESIIAEAEEKAKSILENSKKEIRNYEETAISSARTESDNAVNNAIAEAEDYSKTRKAGCASKLDETVKEVKRIILE